MRAVILALCAVCCFGALQTPPRYRTDGPEAVLGKWRTMENRIRTLVESGLKQALPILTGSETNITDSCFDSLLKVVLGVKDFKLWAFQMLDAWGKPSGGQLVGTASSYGSYDECLALTLPGREPTLVQGKYCLLEFRPALPHKPRLSSQYLPIPEPLRNFTSKLEIVEELKSQTWAFYQAALRLGICIPSTCTQEDAGKLARIASEYIGFNADVHSCQVNEGKKFHIEHLVIIGILAVFVSLTIIASVVEMYFDTCCGLSEDEKPSTFHKVVQAFSIPRNLQKTLSVSSNETSSPVACLHGIRFYSMGWVVLSHTYLVLDPALYRNGHNMGSMGKEFAFQPVFNSSLGVETFIFLTGVLMSYQLVQQVDKRGTKIFNIPVIIFHRIWRLLPSAILAVAATILLPILGSGPVWQEETQVQADNCRRGWWQILLFVNNFGPFNDMCLFHTWYISVDMQLFIFGIFFFILLFWKPALAVVLNVSYILVCIISSTIIAWYLNLTPTMLMSAPDREATSLVAQYTYFLPINQLGIYCLGLGIGTFIARTKEFNIPKYLQALGWLLAVAINMCICFGILYWNEGRIPGRIETALYAGIHRTAWGLGLAWLTLMCATGKAGILNSFLSWSGYTPFNRLTFLVYLFHILVITYFLGSLRGVIDVAHPMIVWLFFGNLTITFGVALILKLLYEAPLIELEHLICEKLMRKVTNEDKSLKKTEEEGGQDNAAMSRL